MSDPRTRTIQLALVGVTVLLLTAIVILIAGIHDFEFLSARPLEYTTILSGGWEGSEAPGWRAVTILMRVLFTIAAVVLLFQLIFSKSFRRYYLVLFLLIGAALVAAEFVGCNRMPPEELADRSTEELMTRPPVQAPSESLPEAPQASGFQYVVAAIVLSSVVVLAASILAMRWLRRRPKPEEAEINEILESLSSAARRIRAGEDPNTVVLFCYQEMLRMLTRKGRIDATYLTPREFERRLESIGLAGSAISRLTEMFELVRYARRVDEGFAARALTCLDAIQEAHAADER